MRIEPDLSTASIVLLGRFNPAILTPAWFAMNKLLPTDVADTARLDIAHPQMTAFAADWLRLSATVEQFTFHTAVPPYIRLCDLACRIFGEHLSHTPLTAFGVNRESHFQVESANARNRLLRLLAPTDPWDDLGESSLPEGNSVEMTSLTMTRVTPPERPASDQINVTVEPSRVVGNGLTGLYVRVNDHFVPGGDSQGGTHTSVTLLEKVFEASLKNSDAVINHIMSLSTKAAV